MVLYLFSPKTKKVKAAMKESKSSPVADKKGKVESDSAQVDRKKERKDSVKSSDSKSAKEASDTLKLS